MTNQQQVVSCLGSDVTFCGRCGKEIAPRDDAEACWFCSGDLCVECWERYGHCGHEGAEEINQRMREWTDQQVMQKTIRVTDDLFIEASAPDSMGDFVAMIAYRDMDYRPIPVFENQIRPLIVALAKAAAWMAERRQGEAK